MSLDKKKIKWNSKNIKKALEGWTMKRIYFIFTDEQQVKVENWLAWVIKLFSSIHDIQQNLEDLDVACFDWTPKMKEIFKEQSNIKIIV